MRNHFIQISLTRLSAMCLLAAALAGCSDNVPTTTTTTITPAPTAPAGLALGTSANWIPTDNSTAATLTATLVDSSNAVMAGVPVSFATTSGNLNASSATTDANGQAIVVLKSGLSDFSNRTATVTATVLAQSASLPLLIKGSTVALTVTPSTTIQVGGGTIAATAAATNAAGLGLSNQTIRFSIGATSTGAATLSAATLTTDATGVTPPLTFTPTAAGTAVLTAEWLDSAGAVTAMATKDIIVAAASGTAFAVTTPASDPLALTTSTSSVPSTQLLVATVPATIAGTTVAKVRISATSGTWTGASPATGPLSSILQTPTAGAVAAIFTAPSNSGSVSVQVDALDVNGTILGTLARTFAISAPSSAAAKVFLAASASTIVPSSGGNISTATLEASVRDINNNSVGGAAVMFGLLGTTGSGESVSPAVAITDSTGKASTTFTAGSASTLAAIFARARLLDAVLPCSGTLPDPVATETNSMCDSASLMVSAAAVGVTVGFGSTVADTANNTQYMLPGSVLVVNSNGSPVAGATVTLSVFPIAYRNGRIYPGHFYSNNTWTWRCAGPINTGKRTWDSNLAEYVYNGGETIFTASEDANRNGILEPGEDTPGDGLITTWGTGVSEDVNSNGVLDYTTEDVNHNGVLDFTTEDVNYNGILDPGEDLNGNGIIDILTTEDGNGNGTIDLVTTEDVNGNGILDANTEDVNGNGILDPGEDTPLNTTALAAQAIGSNGLLAPPQAAGGAVPLTVTTDSNGAATFYLQYPKESAWFIKDEVTARVIVMGTESTAKAHVVLPMSVPDSLAPNCPLAREASY